MDDNLANKFSLINTNDGYKWLLTAGFTEGGTTLNLTVV